MSIMDKLSAIQLHVIVFMDDHLGYMNIPNMNEAYKEDRKTNRDKGELMNTEVLKANNSLSPYLDFTGE